MMNLKSNLLVKGLENLENETLTPKLGVKFHMKKIKVK